MSTRRTGVFHALITRPESVAAMVWLVLLVVGLAIVVPIVSPYTPVQQDLANILQPPSAEHWLGTDGLGRDILTRLAWGSHVTLMGVVIVAVVANVLGAVMGLIAGHFRAGWDATFTWVADILMSIPTLVILLAVSAVTTRNVSVVMLVLGVLLSAGAYRVFRAATLNIRGELYITAARTSGLSESQIIGRHELPRLLGQLIIQSTVVASLALVVQVSLGFLGIDAAPPAPSWGNMIKDASGTIYTNVWPLVPPTVLIAVTVLAFGAIGDVAQRAVIGRSRHGGLGRSRRSRASAKTSATIATATAQSTNALPAGVPVIALPDSGGYVLEVDDLTVTIHQGARAVPLVSNVSLGIAPGEIVGLVGESGAGKSVTARAALGLLPGGATATGSVRLGGEQVLGASERTLEGLRGSRISYISQEPMAALNSTYTVGNQLVEIIRTHTRRTRRDAKARAVELLETVQIKNPDAVLKAYPHQISGGMAQRIMIAIALAGDPEVLVADEPTTALDVSVQMQILDLIRSLRDERGMAVLLVTHDWGVVADICDRGVAMYAGQVVEEATVGELFAEPRHPYSIALRAADPHAQTPGERLSSIAGAVPPPGTWPTGCRFAARCAFATDECRAAPVPLDLVGDRHTARCVRVDAVKELARD